MGVHGSTYIEGFGDEVLFIFPIALILLLTLLYFISSKKGFALPRRGGLQPELRPAEGPHTDNCPICLEIFSYPVQTNCGHLFCGSCVLACWDHTSWLLNPMPCPMCRQTITLIFLNFNGSEAENVMQERPHLVDKIGSYNRRFSGAPRPWIDYIYDIPTLIRQMWSDTGLDLLMRCRIYAYFGLAIVYVVIPMDILPESVFGIVGMIDDIVVIVIIALYLTSTYRNYVAYRNLQPMFNAVNEDFGSGAN